MSRLAPGVLAVLLWCAPPVAAQRVEITPFGGGKLGGTVVEADGGDFNLNGPVAGVTVDVALGDVIKLAFWASREWSDIDRGHAAAPRTQSFTIDTYHVGALQDWTHGAVRPFVTATAGLTRYSADTIDDDVEWLFGVTIGMGVKVRPSPHFGFRVDARGTANFTDGGLGLVCITGGCLFRIDADIHWLGEFTAGVTFAF